MKRIATILILICAGVLSQETLAADKLTNELAQNAIDFWLIGDGTKRVIGVMDFPQQSAAQVDIEVTNFVWKSPKNDAVTAYAFGPGGGSNTYNGKMQAVFKHYNDGRWILDSVSGPMGTFANLNIQAR